MKTVVDVWEDLQSCDSPFDELAVLRAYGEEVKKECAKVVAGGAGSIHLCKLNADAILALHLP